MSSSAPHDLGYKFLFSHPELVRDLVVGFIPDDWLQGLDYSTLERINGSYVSDDLRARSDDMVWRVRTGGKWIYLYLLFEFQSRVDPHMALRMMVYTGLLYQDLIKSGQVLPRGRLPPVLPIVLYNGHRRWRAARDIAELIPALPNPMSGYTPQAKYLLIDENANSNHHLASLRNLVAAVFRIERPNSPQAVGELLGLLVEWLKERPDLARVMSLWISAHLHRKPTLKNLIPQTDNLQELKAMLDRQDRWEQWAQNFRAEGQMQGIERGIEKGQHMALVKTLTQLLVQRFGALSEEAAQRLSTASTRQLEFYLSRVLSAASLDEVFESTASGH